MPETFQTTRLVEFRDTDAAGIVHFSVFFAYMEEAEHELLRHLGMSVVSDIDGKTVSWPRVAARCDYRKAIRFEQTVTIDVSVERIGTKSVTWQFHFRDADGDAVAEGTVTAVCCEIPHGDIRENKRPIPIEIPELFVNKLQPYLIA
ncbi:MAG: acyl-CoA thioesterase [Pirellulaceae bacterium]